MLINAGMFVVRVDIISDSGACRTSVSRRNMGETLSFDACGTPHLNETRYSL